MDRKKESMMDRMKKSMRPRLPQGPMAPRPGAIEEPQERMPRPRPMDMTPSPDQEDRMRRQVEDDRMMRRMGEAYDRAAPESMGTMRAKGGKIKAYAHGGSVGSASKRADGCAQRGKTRGKMI